MRILLIVYCITFFAGNTNAQIFKKNDWERFSIHGRVKNYTEISFYTDDTTGIPNSTSHLKYKWFFNKKGLITGNNECDSRDSIIGKTVYQYSTNNEVCDISTKSKYIIPYFKRYYYKKDGRVDSIYDFQNDSTNVYQKDVFNYQINGECNINIYTYEQGILQLTERLAFQKKIHHQSKISKKYDGNGELISTSFIKFDKKNNLLNVNEVYKSQETGQIENRVKKYRYSGFDKAGNWLQCCEIFIKEGKTIVYVQQRQYTYY